MTDRHLAQDMAAHARRTTGQPEPGLREQLPARMFNAVSPALGGFFVPLSRRKAVADALLALVEPLLDAAQAEADQLRANLRTAAGLLRDTAERTEQQRTVNAGVLRGAAKAIDEITGSQP